MKVMVPIDFSETAMCALKTGIAIANKLKSDLRIVYVAPKEFAAGYEDSPSSVEDAKSRLEKLVFHSQSLYYGKGKFDFKIRTGNTAQELINQSKYDDTTIIVMGSHGVSGITESWIGGNAYKMICNAPCPILVIRPDMKYDVNFRRIVIPVEISKSSRYKIPVVAGVAKLFGAKAIVVGIQTTGFKSIFTRISMSVRQVAKYLTSRANVEVEKTAMLVGKDTTGKLLEIVRDSKVDMLAIDVTNTGTFITDRFRPFLITLVNESHCPVLAIPIKE